MAIKKFIRPYLDALEQEISTIPPQPLDTIYIGGGTPTILSGEELVELCSSLKERFGLPAKEFSIETTISALTPEKISLLASHGVNRISIGVQTFNPHPPYLDRVSNFFELKKLVDAIRQFAEIEYSFDLIYGWPDSTLEELEGDLAKILSLSPHHISCYPLAIEAGTKLALAGLSPLPDESLADQYSYLVDRLALAGYPRYEISNFSRPGSFSFHNLTYWQGDDYLAAGLGACSFLNPERVTRTRSLARYLAGDFIDQVEVETKEEIINDYLMLNLRLTDGFSLSDFFSRFGLDFLQLYQKEIEKVREYLIIDKDRVSVRPELLFVLDSVLVELLK